MKKMTLSFRNGTEQIIDVDPQEERFVLNTWSQWSGDPTSVDQFAFSYANGTASARFKPEDLVAIFVA